MAAIEFYMLRSETVKRFFGMVAFESEELLFWWCGQNDFGSIFCKTGQTLFLEDTQDGVVNVLATHFYILLSIGNL